MAGLLFWCLGVSWCARIKEELAGFLEDWVHSFCQRRHMQKAQEVARSEITLDPS